MVNFLKKYNSEVLFSSVALLVILLDQLTKHLMEVFKPMFNLGFLTFEYIQNTGAGFGILKGNTSILTIISLIAALAVIIGYRKIPKGKIPQILFAVFLGGVLGNFIDRLLRHYVIDFINPGFWPAFNVADMAISITVIGLIIYFWKE